MIYGQIHFPVHCLLVVSSPSSCSSNVAGEPSFLLSLYVDLQASAYHFNYASCPLIEIPLLLVLYRRVGSPSTCVFTWLLYGYCMSLRRVISIGSGLEDWLLNENLKGCSVHRPLMHIRKCPVGRPL